MPPFDAIAAASLGDEVQRPAFFVFLDIVGYPIRATTAGYDVTFTGTGDPDLDGKTFEAIDPRILDVSPVKQTERGSETVTVTVSGSLELDEEATDALSDRTLWQGRTMRLWQLQRDEDGAAIGAIVPYHTGWMSAPEWEPSPETQVIRLRCESYLAAAMGAPSNRSYSGQAAFDPADQSAKATIGAANGVKAGPGGSIGVVGGGEGSGGAGRLSYQTAFD